MKSFKQILNAPLKFKIKNISLDLKLLNCYVRNQKHPSELQKLIACHLADELLETRSAWCKRTVRKLTLTDNLNSVLTEFSIVDYLSIIDVWLKSGFDIIIISGVLPFTKLNYRRTVKLYERLGYNNWEFYKLILQSYIWRCFVNYENPIESMKSNYNLHYIERD